MAATRKSNSRKQVPERVPTRALSTALVKGLIARASAISGISHPGTKGSLRETLLGELLQRFLPIQYSIGTGIIVNEVGKQSTQIDLIVYDQRLVPPFVRTGQSDVFPWQSVVATIEVKSKLTIPKVAKAELNAKRFRQEVFGPDSTALHSVFAFSGLPVELREEARGRIYLEKYLQFLSGICVAGQASWIHVDGKWAPSWADTEYCEETKRYIALIVDNVTTMGESNWIKRVSAHKSWLGAYIREY